jgi:putative NADPH-quinone reductase
MRFLVVSARPRSDSFSAAQRRRFIARVRRRLAAF